MRVLTGAPVVRLSGARQPAIITAMECGAAGDLVTDDWLAIQGAIDRAAAAGGGEVILPHPPGGGYRIKRALQARSGVTLRVPHNGTRIVNSGEAGWPHNGAIYLGNWSSANWSRATPAAAIHPANAVAFGDLAVTLATAAGAAAFAAGDVVALCSTSMWSSDATVSFPTWLRMNVVERVGAGGVIHLRHPIDAALASVEVRRLTRTGGTDLEGGDPLFAIRDFSLYGGTWETLASSGAAFSPHGGAIDCDIHPFRADVGYGVGYGNLYAHSRFSAALQRIRVGPVELSLGSHHNVCEFGTIDCVTRKRAPVRYVGLNCGAHGNTIRIGRLNEGGFGGQHLIEIMAANANTIDIGEVVGGALTGRAVQIADLPYAGAPPDTTDNTVRIGACRLASQQQYVRIEGGAENLRNYVVDSRFFGAVTGNYAIYITAGAGTHAVENTFAEVATRFP